MNSWAVASMLARPPPMPKVASLSWVQGCASVYTSYTTPAVIYRQQYDLT